MARRDEQTRKGAIERLEKVANEPDYVVVRTRLLIHDRVADTKTAKPCRCCRSTTSEIVEEVPDLELLIDTVRGQRYLRHEMFRSRPARLRADGRRREGGRGRSPLH